MSEKLRESLSAVVDDEADDFELRRVIDEVGKSSELKATWDRYHLVSAIMRAEHSPAGAELRERVWAELDFEAESDAAGTADVAISAPEPQRQGRGGLNRASGFAVAAAVALAVVLVGVNVGGPDSSAEPQLAVTEPPPAPVAVTPEREVSPADQDRVAAYMLRHTQQVGMNRPGPSAFTKLATYQRR